jgi:membrane-associated phospholipid phosphatase
MGSLRTAMEVFPYVFHPITVLGVGIIVLIYLEWDAQDADRSMFWRRVGGFLGAGVLSLIPTGTYWLYVGSGLFELTKGNAWQVDALVASGLFVAAGLTWWLWRRYEWGPLVPEAMEILAAVTVPYAALSPVWNVSGHVLIALVPALYLTLVDRRFWPLLSVPVLMVPNRVYLSAHTWAQSVGGFLIAGAVVLSVHRLRARRDTVAASDPA